MTTQKIYIAGPMTGLPDFNYPAFNEAAGRLARLGHSPLNPADCEKDNEAGEPQEWLWYMRRALKVLADADAVALLDGWEGSRGARIEKNLAEALGLEVRPLAAWLALEPAS